MKKVDEIKINNRTLLIFICVFVTVVIAVGGALVTVISINNAKAVVRYGSVTMDEGMVKYFASYYKMLHIRALRMEGINAYDDESFWNSEYEDGVTYGEGYESGLKDYLESLVTSCGVFLDYSSYTAEDKRRVAYVADEILSAKADGSVSVFNSMTEKYGFDYGDFCNAIALLYKADQAKTIIYGEQGLNLKNFPNECKKYLDTYSHVSLLFVRTEETFALDSEGNRVYDENGNAVMRELTADEKQEKQEIINTLSAAIEGKKSGGEVQITQEMFEIYLEKSDGDPDMYEKGYYFHPNAQMTAEFATEFPTVVERALAMDNGEYEKVDCSIGVCFIYKYDITDGAYDDADNLFFTDFYSDAANYLYDSLLEIMKPDTVFSDAFGEIDAVAIPYLEEFYVRSWN